MSEVKFDKSQELAINIEKNTVVSAGAGSGKTSVLAARFSHLVLDKKYGVDEILTLTFTKKATIEMYDRIYRTLKEKNPDSVRDFHKANIKTLDSYCAYIAKLGAHFYGISPEFTVDNAAAEETISSMALPFILQHRDNFALQTFLTPQNYQGVAKDFFVEPMLSASTIASPFDFRGDLEKQRNKIMEDWSECCGQILDSVGETKKSLDEYEGNRGTKFITDLTKAVEKDFPEIPAIEKETFENADSSLLVDFINCFEDFSNISLKGKCPQELKEWVYKIRELSQTLSSIANFVSGSRIASGVTDLIEEFQKSSNEIKRKNSVLTFADVSSLALKILIEHPEIRKAEKKKYKSIMIDEFQDNNDMQKKLLFLLAEKEDRMEKSVPTVDELCTGKLFFVGDEKQSIYRFRGADVSVFRGLSDDFKDGHLKLQTNYRSNPSLIAAFNTIFGGRPYPLDTNKNGSYIPSIFYNKDEDGIPKYEPVYTDAEISSTDRDMILKMDGSEIKKFYEPKIHFAFYEKNSSQDADKLFDDEAQSLWTVREIKKLVEEKNVDPNDIAILFRNYKYQTMYEKNLLYLGIPYNTETVTGFFNSAVVSDMISFLRICAYPKDFYAFEKILRSAIVNLSVQESNAVLSQSESAFSASAKNILQGKSAERYEHAKSLYEKLSVQSKDQPIAKTVSDLWYSFGYRYETLWNQRATMYSTLYDRIFELARNADSASKNLSDFVDSVKTYEDESKHLDDMDIPMEQKPGVHLMTIHKSKGLQFKYVFIPNIDHGSAKDKNSAKVFISKEFGLTVNTPKDPALKSKSNYFWDLISGETKNMAQAELKRLVYVAITRAIDEVYITGCTGGRKMSDSILSLLAPALEYFSADENIAYSPFTVETIEAIEKPGALDFVKGKSDVIKRLEGSYKNAVQIEKEIEEKKYINPSKLASGDDETDLPHQNVCTKSAGGFSEIDEILEKKKGFSAADFGTIAHGFMESAINKCEPKISERNIAGLEGNKKYLDTIIDSCKKMADGFLKTKVGMDAAKSKWHKAEYSFKSLDGEKIVNGQIDLVYENPEGEYTVVDYKTNHEIKPELYYEQLSCYRNAVSQMRNVPPEKVRCVLYYLRHGKDVDITDMCR